MQDGRPLSVVEAVKRIEQQRLLLPGIQRNFVWSQDQIESLFDSLLRGFPLGSLLLWETVPAQHPLLRFRQLVVQYHGKETKAPVVRPERDKPVLAVLDGQQRLTAFNLALRGSYSTSAGAPLRTFHIDLDHEDPDAGSSVNCYRFEFLPDTNRPAGAWFALPEARTLGTDRQSLDEALDRNGLEPLPARRRLLAKLVHALNRPGSLPVVIERTHDLDRVLNIFARINTGGTKLTYVDLLVSTATARWNQLDASVEIPALRQAMNNSANVEPFRFTEDRIVKAGLVLLGVQNPKFTVDSFTRGNRARKLEQQWRQFRQAMTVAAETLARFGLTGRTLAAQNAVIPVAYYVFHRKLKPSYATANRYESDRRRVRAFVARTLLQRGFWTGDVDAVLVATRTAIKSSGTNGFPLTAIENSLRNVKPIDVTDQLIDELCELRYSDRRTLTLLYLLFPHMVLDTTLTSAGSLEKDHIFPLSQFTRSQLTKHGLGAEHDFLVSHADLLPNLQLLRRADNGPAGKAASSPKAWYGQLGPTAQERYRKQGVKRLPDTVAGFEHFWQTRRNFLRELIVKLLSP